MIMISECSKGGVVDLGLETTWESSMARSRAPHSLASPSKESKPSASEFLEEVLPLAKPTSNEIHFRAAVLEVSDPAQLLELAADTALRPFLLCRLAPNAALVDPGRGDELAEMLRRRGHTPKILKSRESAST